MSTAAKMAADPSREMRLERALILLNEALHIIDDVGNRPEVGARLQHVIDSLSGETFASPSGRAEFGPI